MTAALEGVSGQQHAPAALYSLPILQEAGWAPGPVWTGGKSRPHRDSIPGRPARSRSLYRLSYPAHTLSHKWHGFWKNIYWKRNVRFDFLYNV